MLMAVGAMAQQRIQLRSTDKAECERSDMESLVATFSFSSIEAQDYESERGLFSWLNMAGTVIGGNEGDPQIPVVNQLIAVPVGATPRIEVTSYSTTDYHLDDYGIHTLVPRQPSLRKDQKPNEVPFLYNEAAYRRSGLGKSPIAVVSVVGTMRGVRLGKMTIEPVSYDPVHNILRVFNDIEVTVHFDGADADATEKQLVQTYSPYFESVYRQLFNSNSVESAYDDHPDLYHTPVKMLVVTTSTYAGSEPFQDWLTWKKQKGISVDVQVVADGASASDIRSLIVSKYNADHPTFLVIVGCKNDITNYTTYTVSGLNYNPYISDLQYASVDNDVYHDLFMSRMSVSTVTELGNLVNKILEYEKYTMPDPSYLDETLLIAGWDGTWTNRVGKPTIEYANTYYFNSDHGITPHVFITTASGQRDCYDYMGSVGFINYTAHGDIPGWADPQYTNNNVNSLTNHHKYFWAMGNCCLTANWGNSTYSPCFGEAMIRSANKGAMGYIGSVPETYWWEDYYFGVGAFNADNSGNVPSLSGTTTGVYDALFSDNGFNTLNSVPFIGNVAVTYAHANNYTSSVSDEYYWRAYQCLGDGSVMPYLKVPSANTVSHSDLLPVGSTSFTVNADAGSYVSITVGDEIIGVAQVPENGTVDVTFDEQNTPGIAMIVVTRSQRQPYIATVDIAYATQYTVTTAANPSDAGTVTGGGMRYDQSICTLTAEPARGYEFASWDDNSTLNPRSFTVTADASFTANFTPLPVRAVTCLAAGPGSVSANLTSAYRGDIVTLTATPNDGCTFNRWIVYKTGDVNTTIEVIGGSFVMPDYDVTVCAFFDGGTSGANLVVSPTGLDGFAYLAGTGPSPVQAVSVVGLVDDDVTVTAPQHFEISTSPDGPYGSTLTLDAPPAVVGENLSWDFEDGWGGWTNNDADGDGHNWLLGSVDDASSSLTHSGVRVLLSQSWIRENNSNIALTPDNWLLSPQIVLNGTFALWARAQNANYPAEHFGIYVSTSNTDATSFTMIDEWTLSDGNWHQYSVDLSTYTGQAGYIAVRHFNCTDQVALIVDDFSLTVPETPPVAANVYVRLKAGLDAGEYAGETMTVSVGGQSHTVALSGCVDMGWDISVAAGGWYALSTPVHDNGGTDLALTSVTNLTNAGYDLFRYNEEDGTWENQKNHTDFTAFERGRGYIYRRAAGATLTLTGLPNVGNVSGYTLPYGCGDNSLKGFNLVGNPYPHTITRSQLAGPLAEGYYALQADGTWLARTAEAIGVGQAVLVQATQAGTLAVNERDVSGTKSGSAATLAFTLSSGGFTDVAYALLVPSSEGWSKTGVCTNGEGLKKIAHLNAEAPSLSIPIEGDDYAIATINAEAEAFPLTLRGVEGEYALGATGEMEYLHLIDLAEGVDIDLLRRPTYTFKHSGNQAITDRFLVRLRPDGDEAPFAYQNGNSIVVNGIGTLQVFDVMGRLLLTQEINSQFPILNSQFPTGVYLFRLVGDEPKTQKIVIKK